MTAALLGDSRALGAASRLPAARSAIRETALPIPTAGHDETGSRRDPVSAPGTSGVQPDWVLTQTLRRPVNS